MARVQIYKRIAGVPVEQLIARQEKVQARLDREAFKGYVKAKSALSVVKARSEVEAVTSGSNAVQGRSEIEPVVEGAVDRYVVLSDERGDNAALAIEFGRKEYRPSPGQESFTRLTEAGVRVVPAAPGAYVLHKAFGVGPGGFKGTGGGEDVESNGLLNDKASRFRKEVLE